MYNARLPNHSGVQEGVGPVADTIVHRLFDQVKKRGDAPAYLVKRGGIWHATSWTDYGDEIERSARALISLGFAFGDRACILGFNRPEWVIFDLAAMMAGGAPAGIYTTCSPDEVAYILNHSESPVVLLENEEQWLQVRQLLPLLLHLQPCLLYTSPSPRDLSTSRMPSSA